MPLFPSRVSGQNLSVGTSPQAGYTPGDGSTGTFYFGALTNPGLNPSSNVPTEANAIYPEMTADGTIRSVYLTIIVGGTKASETGTGFIRVNNGTDHQFSSVLSWSTTTNNHTSTGLAIPLKAGDFWSVKVVPPVFSSNPTATYYFGQVAISIP